MYLQGQLVLRASGRAFALETNSAGGFVIKTIRNMLTAMAAIVAIRRPSIQLRIYPLCQHEYALKTRCTPTTSAGFPCAHLDQR